MTRAGAPLLRFAAGIALLVSVVLAVAVVVEAGAALAPSIAAGPSIVSRDGSESPIDATATPSASDSTPSLAPSAAPSASAGPAASSGPAASTTPSPAPSSTASPPPSVDPTLAPGMSGKLTLVAAGDVMLARTIGTHVVRDGPEWPFRNVASILREADLAIVNLECTMGTLGRPEPKHYTFRAPTTAAKSLSLAGIDAVSLANNHALDYGRDAFAQALGLLADQDIPVAGAGNDRTASRTPAILERNGVRIALLAYADVPVEAGGFDTRRWIATDTTAGLAWLDLPHMRLDIAAAKRSADHVVVFFHTGFEGRTTPSAIVRQRALAAVDAGASLVIGAHPHVLQGTERYHGGLIAYSLGNFVFDGGGWPAVSHDSAILEVAFTRTELSSFRWHPVVLAADGTPRKANAAESRRILARVAPID